VLEYRRTRVAVVLITQVVLGQPARRRWEEILRGSIMNRLFRLSTDRDIHLVPLQKKNSNHSHS